MDLSQSSRSIPDPLSDVLATLGAQVARRTRLEAAGSWSLAFPALDRLKFVALSRGTCWLMCPGRSPLRMESGDVCLIGRMAYTVASDPAVPSEDGRAYFAADRDTARLGGDDTVMIGGGVAFETTHAEFLLDMLPDVLLVPRSSPGAGTVATILALLDAEVERDCMGSVIVTARLADVLLVEAIRACAAGDAATSGWLGAIDDPRLGRTLRAIHGAIAYPWTVALLAREAGMSRAAFSAEFTRRIGQPPLTYLRSWRLTRARIALARDWSDVATVAADSGYASQSAFGHAYRRAFGTSPGAARPSRGG
uniref:AraC family transcriptional regulator n=1 Tax=uncultured Sphingomonas sp. TaxID=158754 RepID=UPI0035CC78B1